MIKTRPDILVLGGGGRAGDAWLTGVLAAIEDASGFALSGCDYFVGTSAGAVVAARLAAGSALRRPAADSTVAAPPRPVPEASAFTTWALALGGPAASIGMRVATRPAASARALGLRLIPSGGEPIGPLLREAPASGSVGAGGRLGAGDASWDGRLRVVAVERRSGRRVVFGAPGAPHATVGEAVRASCSVPGMFAPTVIGGHEYVDGGVWSLTNADVAPSARGAHLLLLAPTASLYRPLSPWLRAASRAAFLLEASVLTARGATVQTVTPDRSAAAAIGRQLMASEQMAAIHASGYRQGLAL